ncbi:zinc finger protein 862-like [Mercenaria mercenaria]|uniref:zinc finger protein 862-like n=1 Tax=Mercenaria mercenaria TaxID=6596 RepID=UPI00234EBC32|nr:zinc finger protein 862-like [Mercenaria mercenaria]
MQNAAFFAAQKHLDAVARSTLKSQQPLQRVIADQLHKDDALGIRLLQTAYHIGKRELPKEEFRHHLEYASSVGADFGSLLTENAKVTYCSNRSVSELQCAISEVILEDKLRNINRSGVFSLVLDESTDNANKKRVLLYSQCVSEDGLEYCLLSNKQIKDGSANAINIVNLVVSELKEKKIDISKMVGVSTDGASVMTGKTGGVVQRLHEYLPNIVGIHCVAHRTALATSQAARDIPDMCSYSRTMCNVFRYFHNSALRSNRLREIQNILKLPELRFTELNSVRWLSMETAVKAMYRSYPALVMCLERDAVTDSTAKGLFNEVTQYKFVALTHLMMDVLPFMGRLSKNFQYDTIDFTKVQPLVQSTCDSMKDLSEVPGVFMTKLDEFVTKDGDKVVYQRPLSESNSDVVKKGVTHNYEFDGFSESDVEDSDTDNEDDESVGFLPELKYYTQQKGSVISTCNRYVNKLVENLENRFQDSEVLSAMSVVVPENICKSDSVAKYGNDQFKVLVKQFAQNLDSEEKCVSEYRQYKCLVNGSYKSASLLDITTTFMKKYADDFPNMVTILKCCSVLPMSSVKCERGFSTQNRIMSRLRNRLNNQALDDQMRISEDGPSVGDFDFKKALEKWKAVKVRKLYRK